MRQVIVAAASVLGSYVSVVIIFVVTYYIVIRPLLEKRIELKILVRKKKWKRAKELVVKKGDTLTTLRQKIGESTDGQLFYLGTQELRDDSTVMEIGICNGDMLFLLEKNFYPSYWSKGKDEFRIIDITAKAKFIKYLVYSIWKPNRIGKGVDAHDVGEYIFMKITKVERVENLELFRIYHGKRQSQLRKERKIQRIKKIAEIDKKGIETTTIIHEIPDLESSPLESDIFNNINEHYLFHGTRFESCYPICKEGLKKECCTRGFFGKGIYTAEDISKADQYTDDVGIHNKIIFLCRVDLGEMFILREPDEKIIEPPCRECLEFNCTKHKYRFDSCVGSRSHRFREFILYQNNRVYPEYIITFERQNNDQEMVKHLSKINRTVNMVNKDHDS